MSSCSEKPSDNRPYRRRPERQGVQTTPKAGDSMSIESLRASVCPKQDRRKRGAPREEHLNVLSAGTDFQRSSTRAAPVRLPPKVDL